MPDPTRDLLLTTIHELMARLGDHHADTAAVADERFEVVVSVVPRAALVRTEPHTPEELPESLRRVLAVVTQAPQSLRKIAALLGRPPGGYLGEQLRELARRGLIIKAPGNGWQLPPW